MTPQGVVLEVPAYASVRFAEARALNTVDALMALARSAAAHGDGRIPRIKALRPESRRVLRALGMPGLDRFPSGILPHPTHTVAQYCAILGDLDPQALAEEIDVLWAGAPPKQWEAVARQPNHWLVSYAGALEDIWSATQPQWDQHKLTLDWEASRLGSALVTDRLDDFVSTLHHRLSAEDGEIMFEAACSAVRQLGDRPLIFAPLIGRTSRVLIEFDAPDVAYIGYSLQRVDAPGKTSHTEDGLAQLLGPLRSAILRAVSEPRGMALLARQLHCAPSTLTYHCDELERAGLVARIRDGQVVHVYRTDRGNRLLALFLR